jgi:hypothetical protein
MTKVFKVDGVALPDGAILMEGGHTNLPGGVGGLPVSAWYCEPGIGTINVDDPGGDYELAGWHTFTVDEDESIGTERQWSGWLIGRKITRGPYKDGPSRVWEVDILEINGLFNLQVFRANSAQRPAETDVERMTWMIASAPMATTPVFDDGRFSTANPANLAAADFVRSFPVDMAANAAGQSGKNVYAYWSHADGEIGFHYDAVGAGPTCTLAISNVIADKDSTTLYPFLDAELDADAYGLYTGVLLDYVGSATYGENQALIDDLSPTEFSPAEFKRDQMIRSDRISRTTTAEAYVTTYLEAAATEKEDITVGVTVPADQAGLIEAGMNIDVKLTHIPGLEDFTTLPIIRLSKVPTPNRTDTWDVRLQLSRNVKVTLAPGGDPGGLPHTGCEPELVQSVMSEDSAIHIVNNGVDLPAAPAVGNLLIASLSVRQVLNPVTPTGFTGLGTGYQDDPSTGGGHKDIGGRLFYRIVQPGDTAHIAFTRTGDSETHVYISEWAGVDTFVSLTTTTDDTDQSADPMVFGSDPIFPTAGLSVFIFYLLMPSLNVGDDWFPSATSNATNLDNAGEGTGGSFAKAWQGWDGGPQASGASRAVTVTATPTAGNARGWFVLGAYFTGTCSDIPPGVGTGRFNEFVANGDDTTTVFTTRYPYAPGSLRVFVDGVPIVNGLTESDPATGEFTLDFAPHAATGDTRAEIVTANYQVGTT